MEISLEQIELVKDRTGVSYKEAKEALENANGNVVDAIIYIEENINVGADNGKNSSVDEIVNYIKNAIRSGNVTRIRVLKDEEVFLNIPVTVGTLATIVFPWGVVAAAVASAATKCKVELVKEDGTIVDVNEKAGKVVNSVKDKGNVVFDEIKVKSGDFYESAKTKGSEVWDEIKNKSGDVFESAKNAGSTFFEEVKTKGAEIYESTKDKFGEFISKEDEEVIDITDIDFEEESDMVGDVDAGADNSADK